MKPAFNLEKCEMIQPNRVLAKARRLIYQFHRPQPPSYLVELPNSSIARDRRTTFPTSRINSYFSLENFLDTSVISSGIHSVWDHGLPIDMSLSVRKDAPLVVVFHGAADAAVKLPWLSGGGVMKDIQASRLSISDPTLYLDSSLNLAWFSGSSTQPQLISVLIQIIEKIRASIGATNLILFGGSGGGFAALRLAPFLPKATALVMNPQTDIEKYHETHVDKYLDLAWSGDLDNMRSVTTNVMDAIRGRQDNFSVYYMQNSADIFHVERHLDPFIREFHSTEKFYLLKDAWREGHTPPPKEVISEVLEAIINFDEQKLKKSLGFKAL